MKKILFVVVIFLIFPVICFSEDFYVTNVGAGLNDGLNLENAFSVTDFNTSGHWANPKEAGKIGPGDTVYIDGTISSSLKIQGSGSPGSDSVITIKFHDGAKFSKAYWGGTTSAAIVNNGYDYIVIDGGNNGIIECTDNGTALGSQKLSVGIYFINTNNCEIKNLTIQNIYVRTPDSSDSGGESIGIYGIDNNTLSIHDNTIEDVRYNICCTAAAGGNKTGLNIYNNDLSRMSTGIVVRLDGPVNYADVNIYNNTISDGYVWDGEWGGGTAWNHVDGIHTWGNYPGNTLGTITIYNNTIGSDMGEHASTWIYLSDYTMPAVIYNNLFTCTAEGPSEGYLSYHNYGVNGNLKFYNNTIVGPSSGNTGGTGVYMPTKACTASIKNNIFMNIYIGIYDPAGNNGSTLDTDYNDFFNVGNVGRDQDGWYGSLTSWQTNTNDEAHSITTDPSLNANYKPNAGNDSVVDKGINLSDIFTIDKDYNTRSGIWDIGAYEYPLGGYPTISRPQNLCIR